MLTVPPPHGCVSVESGEVTARRMACEQQNICSLVVMSVTRKRRRVIGTPVELTNLRRIESVPELPLPVRMEFGAAVEATQGESKEALIVALRWMGLARFSGPAAPSTELRLVKSELVSESTRT